MNLKYTTTNGIQLSNNNFIHGIMGGGGGGGGGGVAWYGGKLVLAWL